MGIGAGRGEKVRDKVPHTSGGCQKRCHTYDVVHVASGPASAAKGSEFLGTRSWLKETLCDLFYR